MVEAEVERVEGKFASRDEIGGYIIEALEGADPGNMSCDNGGEYSVTEWNVNEDDGKAVQPTSLARAAEIVPDDDTGSPMEKASVIARRRRTVRDLTAMFEKGVSPTPEQQFRIMRDTYALLTGKEIDGE